MPGAGPGPEPGFRENAEASRFEIAFPAGTVTADFLREPGLLVVTYVYAPPALRGTGAADRLMRSVAEQARAEERRILPLCGYARRWLGAHPAHSDLLVRGRLAGP